MKRPPALFLLFLALGATALATALPFVPRTFDLTLLSAVDAYAA